MYIVQQILTGLVNIVVYMYMNIVHLYINMNVFDTSILKVYLTDLFSVGGHVASQLAKIMSLFNLFQAVTLVIYMLKALFYEKLWF